MKTITLENGTKVQISDESYKALQDGVKSKKNWRAEKGGGYYYVDDCGEIECDTESFYSEDNYRYTTGNYFQTKKEAIAHRDRQLAIGRVTHAIIEANDGWEPDWGTGVEGKYSIYYSHDDKKFRVANWFSKHLQHLQNIPYCKSEELLEKIKDDYQDDLRVIWKLVWVISKKES